MIPEQLRELAARFECCEWIVDTSARVTARQGIVREMVAFCSSHAVNKNAFLQASRLGLGLSMALASTIIVNTERGDDKKLLRVRAETVIRGVAQYVMVDAITALDDKGLISKAERTALIEWAEIFRRAGYDYLLSHHCLKGTVRMGEIIISRMVMPICAARGLRGGKA